MFHGGVGMINPPDPGSRHYSIFFDHGTMELLQVVRKDDQTTVRWLLCIKNEEGQNFDVVASFYNPEFRELMSTIQIAEGEKKSCLFIYAASADEVEYDRAHLLGIYTEELGGYILLKGHHIDRFSVEIDRKAEELFGRPYDDADIIQYFETGDIG